MKNDLADSKNSSHVIIGQCVCPRTAVSLHDVIQQLAYWLLLVPRIELVH